jgi:hypothetical protein
MPQQQAEHPADGRAIRVENIRANRDPDWIVFVFRGIGEMTGDPTLTPNPAGNWIDLSPETDPLFGNDGRLFASARPAPTPSSGRPSTSPRSTWPNNSPEARALRPARSNT